MTREQLCTRPDCGGNIVGDICENCGRAAHEGSLVERFAANWKSTLAAAIGPSRGKINSDEILDEEAVSNLNTRDGSQAAKYSTSQLRAQQERRSSAQTRALGAGFIALATQPKVNPDELILKDLTVPEHKRVCGHCTMQLHYMKGWCPKCGREYSLVPTLNSGDTVADQYEIKGPIAFGGLGWVYLAWDRLLSRDVVLKGLLNSKDEISAAAAMQERRYLAAVKHPNIVGIYNFVSHGREGFIVMEFINGKTLKHIRQERGALPVAEAIAYIHRILAAFSHLHQMGLVYCDFKPDNFMLEGDDVKLIDMGGVRRNGEQGGEIYCTKGYAAPESDEQPSPVSDLYTIARTLAVLVLTFPFQNQHEFSLPSLSEEPFFAQHESLYRFLAKATRKEAYQRFQSAQEMAQQLLGVLAEEAPEDYSSAAIESSYFENLDSHGNTDSEGLTITSVPGCEGAFNFLPPLRIDLSDPCADELAPSLSERNSPRLQQMFESLLVHTPKSIEVKLRLAELKARRKLPLMAESLLADLLKEHPDDWRVHWHCGKVSLLQGHMATAQLHFDRVYSELPGELMPKLALAICAEIASETEIDKDARLAATNFACAKRCYRIVAKVDHTISVAIFGAARCMLRESKRLNVVEALKKIPPNSIQYLNSQIASVRALILPLKQAPIAKEHLVEASAIIEAMAVQGYEKHRLCADLCLAAIKLAETPDFRPDHTRLLGVEIKPYSLRESAEKHLRSCAKFASSERLRCRLVDEANKLRPLTLF